MNELSFLPVFLFIVAAIAQAVLITKNSSTEDAIVGVAAPVLIFIATIIVFGVKSEPDIDSGDRCVVKTKLKDPIERKTMNGDTNYYHIGEFVTDSIQQFISDSIEIDTVFVKDTVHITDTITVIERNGTMIDGGKKSSP